jgi:nitrogen fixation NifU-like protein
VRNWTVWCGTGWKQTITWRKRTDENDAHTAMPGAGKPPSCAFASRFTPYVSRTPIMFEDLNDLYQQVILDHCKKPRNFHELPAATCSAQGHNPLCGDRLQLFLALDGDTIKDISFVGSGCCISKASASLLTEFAKGKTKADVEKMFGQVHEMVTTGNIQGDVGKLAVFAGVHKFPARVKCAILSWHAVMAALKGDAKPVSTENEQT